MKGSRSRTTRRRGPARRSRTPTRNTAPLTKREKIVRLVSSNSERTRVRPRGGSWLPILRSYHLRPLVRHGLCQSNGAIRKKLLLQGTCPKTVRQVGSVDNAANLEPSHEAVAKQRLEIPTGTTALWRDGTGKLDSSHSFLTTEIFGRIA